MSSTMTQVLSLVGAVLILVGYAGHQYAGLRSNGATYALLNTVGSVLLAVTALRPLNMGVLLMETVWAGVSLAILVRLWRARGRALRR